MINKTDTATALHLRDAETVMRLARMGAAFPTRLSFMRVLIRQLHAEGVKVMRPVWEIDNAGYGRAVYQLALDGQTYSLVAFSTALEADKRSDRVIAEAWDASFALFDGVPDRADLDRLEANVPLQEAGRYEPTELSLSRANKSVRFWDHVVDRLAAGQQPDAAMMQSIGYLMRTTAVYGNGKLGFADRARIAERPALRGSFQVEMLAVWLIREFTLDLVEHVARCRSPETFRPLIAANRRSFGIGNATGLGMAPFLVNHGALMSNWVLGRETALARARAVASTDAPRIARALHLIDRAGRHLAQWNVDDTIQMARIATLRDEWADIRAAIDREFPAGPDPWDRLVDMARDFSTECQELVVSLIIELHGDLVDDLSALQVSPGPMAIDAGMKVADLSDLVRRNYGFALATDFENRAATAQFWYVSQSKLEPRLGQRYDEPGAEKESPLDIARQAMALSQDLSEVSPQMSVAEFLLAHPEHRQVTRRVQTTLRYPYSEIHDNLIAADCRPIDMLRFKLAFFGASKFDPKSDLWTRITMFQGAPLASEVGQINADDWWLPVLGEGA